jgi:NAD(P)-dependent dehydrogenase (short-subunit alcohol dehydrogenase family)
MRGIHGRTAIVTGGAGGIGSVIAQRLAAEGGLVRVIDATPADATVEAVRAAGGDAACAVVDVREEDAVRDQFAQPGWAPELLVNVAGVFVWEDVPPPGASEDWRLTLDVNLTGAHVCCAAAAAAMCARGFGRIVNISSNAALVGFRNMPAYVASKAGLLGLTRALAVDLGPRGVTVNAVAPGSIAAGLGLTSGWTSDPRIRAWDASRTPLQRVGAAEDVAGAVAFLVSDDASWITGQTIVVDGGFAINGGPDIELGA